MSDGVANVEGVSENHESRESDIDTAAALVAGVAVELDSEEANRIRQKIDWHIMPLLCVMYWIQFMDKTTLGNSAVLGIITSTRLTTNQYNWLGTIFYLSYLVFEYPQNLALQRFPVSKWISLNIAVWAIVLLCHAACTNFAGLFVVRFLLGVCEGSITSGFMIISSMFYTRNEQILRVGYWFMMDGTAEIISGFISFGVLHSKTSAFQPWQWLMVITGTLTLITAGAFWFLFPNSPLDAWFLNQEERVKAIQRIKQNQTGVENKRFKKDQAIEALTDPKTWLFAAFAALHNIPTSLTNQRQLIISSFGFSNLQTTLLGCVNGVIVIVTTVVGTNVAARIPNSRAFVGTASYIPNILGALLVSLLPWSNQVGLLISIWLTGFGTVGFVLSLSWLSSVTCGHTKRITSNAIFLIAYCAGNAAGPSMWRQQYKPRNHVPWIVIGICYVSCMSLLLLIRYILARENELRDTASLKDNFDKVYLVKETVDGNTYRVRVDKELLDLTDRQNLDFRYVL